MNKKQAIDYAQIQSAKKLELIKDGCDTDDWRY